MNEEKADRKQNKELLIAFTDAVVYPWTVVIHLPNAPTTNAEIRRNQAAQFGIYVEPFEIFSTQEKRPK